MANIFEINRVSNKITLGTTDTTINIASHTASKILALDASKNLEVVTIGASLDYTRPTLNTIQDIRTSATPLFAGIIIADGGTIGQSAGPLLTFNDTTNVLGITGCKVGIDRTDPDNALTIGPTALGPFTGTLAVISDSDSHSGFAAGESGTDWGIFKWQNDATPYLRIETGNNRNIVFAMGTGKLGISVIPKTRLTVEGTLTLKEQAAADGDTADYGQLWVKNTTPCELWFTRDDGTDVLIV